MFAPTAAMSSSTSISEEASVYSEAKLHDFNCSLSPLFTPMSPHPQPLLPQHQDKKKRSQPGNPDPDAEVIALSPKSLMATNRFVCEVCSKGFQRDQNLQLHRRGHNLPWKLRQRGSKEAARKRVYVCPEASCVHHHPSRALGDLTGIKKHYSRKHGEKKWKCDKCSKKYAVHSDWKAHVKACGTREYRCDCGTLFSRKDSFITHRAFCDALAEESAKLIAAANTAAPPPLYHHSQPLPFHPFSSCLDPLPIPNPNPNPNPSPFHANPQGSLQTFLHPYVHDSTPYLSATALLQKACTMGAMSSTWQNGSSGLEVGHVPTWQKGDRLTRDFLGVGEELPPVSLDPMIVPPCDHGDTSAGPLAAFLFPPATEAWGNC